MEKNLYNNDENKVSEGVFEWSGVPNKIELLNMLCDLSIKYEIVKRKLKEQNKLLEKWQERAVTTNGALDGESYNQILKANTKQVCEKIRERVKQIKFNKIPEKTQQAIKFSVCYEIDQIERGGL